MCSETRCNSCESLVKKHIGNGPTFEACCNRSFVTTGNEQRTPRIIQVNSVDTTIIVKPSWCPKDRGVYQEYGNIPTEEMSKTTPLLPTTTKLTYNEKKEKLMSFPRKTEWDDIKVGEIYVIPRILYFKSKVVRCINKIGNTLDLSEIDENGNESQVLTQLEEDELDARFITKFKKY